MTDVGTPNAVGGDANNDELDGVTCDSFEAFFQTFELKNSTDLSNMLRKPPLSWRERGRSEKCGSFHIASSKNLAMKTYERILVHKISRMITLHLVGHDFFFTFLLPQLSLTPNVRRPHGRGPKTCCIIHSFPPHYHTLPLPHFTELD